MDAVILVPCPYGCGPCWRHRDTLHIFLEYTAKYIIKMGVSHQLVRQPRGTSPKKAGEKLVDICIDIKFGSYFSSKFNKIRFKIYGRCLFIFDNNCKIYTDV